ncbi:hypothetical protein LINPERPRIM_LOCUS41682 [Linum perenne]
MRSFVSSSHLSFWSVGGRVQNSSNCKLPFSGRVHNQHHHAGSPCSRLIISDVARSPASKRCRPVFATVVGGDDDDDDDDSEDGKKDDNSSKREGAGSSDAALRDNLERIVGRDDSKFSGIDLATLIRNKYGRSYDVQLIKKEFMGKNFLAMNVMWKYTEQRSFPLTEEEYLLRLDDVANTLKCWGAVSHIRDSIAKLKERPRIGKAVSIFIDMDETGGRANEWIYK